MEAQTEQPVEATAVTAEPQAKLSQKDAVFVFVVEAVEASGTLSVLEPGQERSLKEIKEKVTKDVRKVVRQRLFAAVQSGDVKVSKQFTDSKLKKYCSGLINNWLKKDSRFN